MNENAFVPKIGFEIHIQVNSNRKAFAWEGYDFNSSPNSHLSVVSMGYPGSLPVPNIKLIGEGIKLGLALNCKINTHVYFYRKNYFYPDLPKGYQISQYGQVLCYDGEIYIDEDCQKKVRILEIHIEEDTGKSIHDQHPYYSLIDFNRAGVPLIELVTAPDITSPDDAVLLIRKIRRIVRYLGISDANMEEGNLRCDTNISILDIATNFQHNKIEIKNLNSTRNIYNALKYEIKRQIYIILAWKNGKIGQEGISPIERETRMFNPQTNKTYPLRSKEYAHDYRYFPEPDIPPIKISSKYLADIRKSIPELPEEKIKKYILKGIPKQDAIIIAEDPHMAVFFEEVLQRTPYTSVAVYFFTGPIKNYLNTNNIEMEKFPVGIEKIAELINLVGEGKVAKYVATQDIFEELVKNPEQSPLEIAMSMGKIIKMEQSNEMESLIQSIIEKYPEKVKEYKKGKKGIVGMFMGELNKVARGKFNPQEASKLIIRKLESYPD